ncbi:hypothetical protein [Parabacteroides provencensis]|uniref:hypothetical protein n=1 Tax=Parabacteroides provencensis TaxID=1944636 RepID=UPI001E33149D|nr:hypothetical protein [Parabacteroides provencensis]
MYEEKEQEIEEHKKRIILQQNELLMSSAIAKKVIKLGTTLVPNATKSPLTEKDWERIRVTVNDIYSGLGNRLLLMHMSETELRYCFLCLFGQDINSEAIFLNINPESVNKCIQRVRQRLGIIWKNYNLASYLE